MNITLTKEQEEYILKQVASGDYQNNSQVIRDALRLHQIYRHKVITDLKLEIDKGIKRGISNRSVNSIIKAKLKSSSSR